MEKYQTDITKVAEEFIKKQFDENLPAEKKYHNFSHTEEVVAASIKIAEAESISPEQMEMLIVAAWFHDIGHVKTYNGHEDVSMQMAEEFLEKYDFPREKIGKVISTIGATKMPQTPTDILQKILADADLYHLASKNFDERATWLRFEWENLLDDKYTDEEWIKQNLKFLRGHEYFTDYAKLELQPKKDKIIKDQKKLQKKLQKEKEEALMTDLGVDKDELKELQKKLSKMEGWADRGVETMFRTTSKNHIELSSIADSKANIMISVNSIIISIIVGALASKLDTNPYLVIPASILLIVCVTTIVFAIIATRPNITSGRVSKEAIKSKKANLLFFGNFHSMSLEDYEWGMNRMMQDSDYLYGSLIRDIYFLGAVLGKKYRLLRISYTIFMFGLIISVIAFIIATATASTTPMNTF
ncbi:MAG: HD superfamily phosphodiesterase [Arenicella sp.]|jgi:HD superfamily phosphodiesterase